MRKTKILMGMPITVEIIGCSDNKILAEVFDYFNYVDRKFSTYKKDSEISKINRGEIMRSEYSSDMEKIFKLAEQTKNETGGYFDIVQNGKIDPSGIVKGWAILNAAKILKRAGYKNFYVEAGGDIQVSGRRKNDKKWRIGIRNPFNREEIIKALEVSNLGIATSGTYERGHHIYNPKTHRLSDEIASITVIAPNVYEADRFATAAFAMGTKGIEFIEKQKNLEGYLIGKKGIATYTSGLENYIV